MKKFVLFGLLLMVCGCAGVNRQAVSPGCPAGQIADTGNGNCKNAINQVSSDKYFCPPGMEIQMSQKQQSGAIQIGVDWVRCAYPEQRKQ